MDNEIKRFFVMLKDVNKGEFFNTLAEAENCGARMTKNYPHLKVSIYKLLEIGEVASPPVKWTNV